MEKIKGDTPFRPFAIPLTGKLITADDSVVLGEGDFSKLTNMRYTRRGIRGVLGHTKFNTSAYATYSTLRSGFHFSRQYPVADESHVVYQGWNAAETASVILGSTIPIGTSASTASTLLSDQSATTGTGIARYSVAPYGTMVACTGAKNLVWGGNGIKAGRYIDKADATLITGTDTNVYRCIKSHTSESDNKPVTGANYLQYWKRETNAVGGTWVTATPYNSDYLYDYTVAVNNTLSSASDVAYVHSYKEVVDTDTKMILHFQEFGGTPFEDSTSNNHDATINGTVTTSDSYFKFGSRSCRFPGLTTEYLTVSDHSDFDMDSGNWTIDFWIYNVQHSTYWFSHAKSSGTGDYIRIGSSGISIYSASSEVASLSWPANEWLHPSTGWSASWDHIAVVGKKSGGNFNYYLFRNGVLKASLIGETHGPANTYDRDVVIGGWDNGSNISSGGWAGYIDEFRFSRAARWISDFSPPTSPYGDTYKSEIYVGSILPIKGIYFDVVSGTESTGDAASSVYYWDGTSWMLTPGWTAGGGNGDNTSTSSHTLGQDGWMLFNDTSSVAKPSIINDIYLYWYLVSISGSAPVSTTTKINQVYLKLEMQDLVDLWDGQYRPIASYVKEKESVFYDETMNVTKDFWTVVSGTTTEEPSTYSSLFTAKPDPTSTTGGNYLYIGCIERSSGLQFKVIPGKANTNTANLSVEYWDGDSWVSVGTLNDETSVNGKTLSASGTVHWTPPSESSEFRTNLKTGAAATSILAPASVSLSVAFGGTDYGANLYYYRVSVDATITATYVYYINAIPAPATIRGHVYPAYWHDRLWIADEASGNRNSLKCSSSGTVNVFNGSDSYRLFLGDDSAITAMAGIMNRFGTDVSDVLLVVKETSTWIVYWRDPTTATPGGFYYKCVTDKIGCPSPGTFVHCDTGINVAQGVTRTVSIWLANNGMALYDQSSIVMIQDDIQNYFDDWRSEYINYSVADKFYADFDTRNQEYHLYVATGASTDLNKEFVFSLRDKKWFVIDRGAALLNGSFSAVTTTGVLMNYGFGSAGYLYRLENGQTFDGTSITYNFRTGAKALAGFMAQTMIRKIRLLAVSKDTTSHEVTISDYIDTSDTPMTAETLSLVDTSRRVAFADDRATRSVQWGPGLTHELDFTITATSADNGLQPLFEPLAVGGSYKIIRDEVGV